MKGLWDTIQQNHDAVIEPISHSEAVAVEIKDRMFGSYTSMYGQAIYDCLDPGAVRPMKDGAFDARDLSKTVRPVCGS